MCMRQTDVQTVLLKMRCYSYQKQYTLRPFGNITFWDRLKHVCVGLAVAGKIGNAIEPMLLILLGKMLCKHGERDGGNPNSSY